MKKFPAISDKNKKNALIGGAGVIGLGVLGYFLLSGKKEKNDKLPQITVPSVVGGQSTSKWTEGSFPLKQGDYNNNKVYRLQKALGMSDADGDFGPKTAAALTAKGFPVVVTEAVYNTIIGGGNAGSGSSVGTLHSAKMIADTIYNSAIRKSLTAVIGELRKMNTTADYTAVNTEYKKFGLVSKTLVTHLLDDAFTFPAETDRQQIRNEFIRIGLKYNGSSWSLSGLGMLPAVVAHPTGKLVKTIAATAVRDQDGKLYEVPSNSILGTELGRKDGIALILAANNSLLYATGDMLTITE